MGELTNALELGLGSGDLDFGRRFCGVADIGMPYLFGLAIRMGPSDLNRKSLPIRACPDGGHNWQLPSKTMRQHGLSVGFEPAEATLRHTNRCFHRDNLKMNSMESEQSEMNDGSRQLSPRWDEPQR